MTRLRPGEVNVKSKKMAIAVDYSNTAKKAFLFAMGIINKNDNVEVLNVDCNLESTEHLKTKEYYENRIKDKNNKNITFKSIKSSTAENKTSTLGS